MDMKNTNLSLQTKYMGRKSVYFDEVDSTNAYLFSYEGPFTEGMLVSTDYQTYGTGRKKRKWFASRGASLLFSIMLTPKRDVIELPEITQVLALAISNVIEDLCKVTTTIKWPNDIYIGNRKCCGILSQLRFEEDLYPLVIIGAGLNVNEYDFPKDISKRATSLLHETGIRWDRAKLLSAILVYFERYYEKWKGGGFKDIIEDISLRFYLSKKKVKVIVSDDNIIYGEVLGLDPRGYLLVREDRGRVHSVIMGDVIQCS